MKKYLFLLLLLSWLVTMATLFLSLSDFLPGNPLKVYRFFIIVVLLCLSGFLRETFRSFKKKTKLQTRQISETNQKL